MKVNHGTLVPTIIFLGLATFLTKILLDGTFNLYSSPRYYWPVFAATILLYLKGVNYIPRLLSGKPVESKPLAVSIFLTVIIVAFLVAPATLSYQDALSRGTSNIALPASNLISILPTDLIGKEVTLVGFVHKINGLGEGRFLLVRFLIRCCLADAQPVGIIIQYVKPLTLDLGSWIVVKGVVTSAKITATVGNQSMEVEELVVVASSIEVTNPPQEPYAYPGDDFSQLAAIFL